MRAVKLMLLLILLTTSLAAQEGETARLRADIDYACFEAQDGWSYVEIYLSFARRQFFYQPESDEYEAQFSVSLDFFQNDSVLSSHEWKNVDRIGSLDDVSGSRLYDQRSVFLKPGTYRMRAGITDLHDNRRDTSDTDIRVTGFGGERLQLSDIQLGLRITADEGKSKFVKNKLNILPNPYALYSEDWPVLYYYFELYNLSPLQRGVDSTYHVSVSITDTTSKRIEERNPKVKIRRGRALVEVGSLVVSPLLSDSYLLEVEVVDAASSDTVRAVKPFYVFRSADFTAASKNDAAGTEDEESVLSESDVDQLFEKLQYISTKEENKLYKSLYNLKAKIAFLQRFWDRRDPDPADRRNAFKDEYLERLAKVEYNFSSGSRAGWKTDQGRVFLTYGAPDHIDRFPSNLGQKPYEIWQYQELDSGVEFVFVDQGGYREMILVHSTHRNEIQDYRWQEKWFRD